jgi:hypothetical protein
MNLKQFASIGILVTGLGFLGLKSVDARTSSSQSPTSVSNPSTDVVESSQSSSYTIAQTFDAQPIYATWKLTHSFAGFVHESTVVMNGLSGVMRTKFFNPATNKMETVKQNIILKSVPRGLMLIGSNPVYDGTSKPHPTYVEDNFMLSVQPDGPFIVLTCDRENRCSDVEFEVIK